MDNGNKGIQRVKREEMRAGAANKNEKIREAKDNHFSTTGRCSGPAHYDVSIRQAATTAIVT